MATMYGQTKINMSNARVEIRNNLIGLFDGTGWNLFLTVEEARTLRTILSDAILDAEEKVRA